VSMAAIDKSVSRFKAQRSPLNSPPTTGSAYVKDLPELFLLEPDAVPELQIRSPSSDCLEGSVWTLY